MAVTITTLGSAGLPGTLLNALHVITHLQLHFPNEKKVSHRKVKRSVKSIMPEVPKVLGFEPVS